MRATVVVLALAAALLAGTAASAAAAATTSCGSVSGWKVSADPRTTTCGLARSATRDFLRRLGRGEGLPARIVGRSPKTGRRYRLRKTRDAGTQTTSDTTYTGRAGEAVLKVRIRTTVQ